LAISLSYIPPYLTSEMTTQLANMPRPPQLTFRLNPAFSSAQLGPRRSLKPLIEPRIGPVASPQTPQTTRGGASAPSTPAFASSSGGVTRAWAQLPDPTSPPLLGSVGRRREVVAWGLFFLLRLTSRCDCRRLVGVMSDRETAPAKSALSGPTHEPRSQNVELIGCQSVRQRLSFLGLRAVVRA
jgi:hypothetical protein